MQAPHPPFTRTEMPSKKLYQQIHRVYFLGSTVDLPPFNDSVGIPNQAIRLDSVQPNVPQKFEAKTYEPLDSMLCGAGWAFILSYLGISPLDILTRFPQQRCGGGSISKALSDVYLSGGVCKNRDKEWCGSPICGALVDTETGASRDPTSNSPYAAKREGYEEYSALRWERVTDEMNSTLHPPSKCVEKLVFDAPFSISANKLLTIQSPNQADRDSDLLYNLIQASGISPATDENIHKSIYTAQRYIYEKGPLLSVIPVYDNLLDLNFRDTNGVYFDQIPYSNKDATRFRGCIAVCVVGWDSQLIQGKVVKYWIVKTVLGKLFRTLKIPMFVNKRVCLEHYQLIKLPTDGDGAESTFITGGFHGAFLRKFASPMGSILESEYDSSAYRMAAIIIFVLTGLVLWQLYKR